MSGEARASSPFTLRAVLALVVIGALAFVAMLWFIARGDTGGGPADGGAHVGGQGLTGYAALANLLDRQGYPVSRVQSPDKLGQPGLLVLTPPFRADPKVIMRTFEQRRCAGATMLVLPKWRTSPVQQLGMGGRKGWVYPFSANAPEWAGQLPGFKLTVVDDFSETNDFKWSGFGREGALPGDTLQYVKGEELTPLVTDPRGRILIGYRQEHGVCGDVLTSSEGDAHQDQSWSYPQIVVADPDLLNNWGMAESSRAMAALDLANFGVEGTSRAVQFDLTIAGLAREQNLLTLAFRPPFLAATLCLLLAALAIGWRAFRRFGPPLAQSRAIAFGKRALVVNSAGLVRRSGRLHLLGSPYAALLRDRLVRTLALPRHADAAQTEAAIDRALARRAPGSTPFSVLAENLRRARRPQDLLRSARALHALERTLTR